MADNTAPEQFYRPTRETIARAMRASKRPLPSLVPAEPPRLACDPDRVFNLYVLRDLRGLSHRAGERIGQSHTYIEALPDIEPVLTQDDQKVIANAKWAASLMEKKIVSDYQGSFGVISRQDIATAQLACGRFAVTSQHDFVVIYILGCLWSGHAAVAKPPMSLSRMVSAKDLAALLPAMPPNGSQVVTDVSIYLSILKKVSKFLVKSPLGLR
jgi:hypothetical protein